MEPVPTGFLVINVLEAAGHDSNDAGVWEPDFKEGYARGEAVAPGGSAHRRRVAGREARPHELQSGEL